MSTCPSPKRLAAQSRRLLNGVPALLVPSPSPEDRHVIRAGPQLLVGTSVTVDEPLERPTTLTAELIPARHLPSPLSARNPSENPKSPAARSQMDAPGLPGSQSAAGPDPPFGAVAASVGCAAPHRADRRPFCRAPDPMCLLDFAGLLPGLPHMPK